MKKTKILFITVATGKYIRFLPKLHESIAKYVLKDDKYKVSLLYMSDQSFTPNVEDEESVKAIHRFTDHLPFPLSTLLRYHMIAELEEKFLNLYDYIYYIDADMEVVSEVGEEILGDRVAVVHPGFWQTSRGEDEGPPIPYEQNSVSCVYGIVPTVYYQGCFQGGKREIYMEMVQKLKKSIGDDLLHNHISEWWDETHYNAYLVSSPPTLALEPKYAMPECWVGVQKARGPKIWKEVCQPDGSPALDPNGNQVSILVDGPYNIAYECSDPKIVHLMKNHTSLRIS